MTTVILISGKAGVGKTTAARYLQRQLDHYGQKSAVVGFAIGIKECARQYIGWNGAKDERGRRLLQTLGTEAGRAYDDQTWPKYLFEKYIPREYPDVNDTYTDSIPLDFVLVDDWRFNSEYKYTTGHYATYTIRIESPDRELLKGTPEYFHTSETELPSDENPLYDFVVYNTGTMEEFEKKLNNIVDFLAED